MSIDDDEIERAAVLKLALRDVEFMRTALNDPDGAEWWLKVFGMDEESARALLCAPLAAREVKKRRGPKADFIETLNRPSRLKAYEMALDAMKLIHRLTPKGITEAAGLRRALAGWRVADASARDVAAIQGYGPRFAVAVEAALAGKVQWKAFGGGWTLPVSDEILRHVAEYRRQRLGAGRDALPFEVRAAMAIYGREDGPPPPGGDPLAAMRHLRKDQRAEQRKRTT